MQRTLGIDLGTTNSVMAHMTRGEPRIIRSSSAGEEITPSVVGISKSGSIAVGRTAKNRGSNSFSSIKRFMGRKYSDEIVQRVKSMNLPYEVVEGTNGNAVVKLKDSDQTYTPVDISAMILRQLRLDAEASVDNGSFRRAVISVPAYFGERHVAATKEAGHNAGFHVLQIEHEPTAAALAYGLDQGKITDPQTILVYDFGGGTFDLSILDLVDGVFNVFRTGGNLFLGGDNLDQLIFDHIRRQTLKDKGLDLLNGANSEKVKNTLRNKAETAKIELSSMDQVDIDLPMMTDEIDVSVKLTRDQFEGMIGKHVEESMVLTEKLIREAGLTTAQVNAVILVGGTTLIPLVQRRLADMFGPEKVRRDVDPMLCVGVGAAIQSALIKDISCPSCQTNNPINLETCSACGTALYGTDSPVDRFFVGAKAASPVQSRQVSRHGQTDVAENEPLGLRCQKCGTANRPGADHCATCGEAMVIRETVNVTPHPIGIELQDGRLSELIPVATPFPVPAINRTYFTSSAGQRRLEINVFEGDKVVARDNDLVGIITIPLANNYPKGTPIEIALGLDKSRNIDVSVRVNPPTGESRKDVLQRERLRPDLQQRVAETRDRIAGFLDEWEMELLEVETGVLSEMMERCERLMSGSGAKNTTSLELEDMIANASLKLAEITKIRWASAVLSNLIDRGEGLLPDDKIRSLRALDGRLDHARQSRDSIIAMKVADEVEKALDALGAFAAPILAENHADSGKLSPSLANRIHTTSGTIRSGMRTGDEANVEAGFRTLFDLWEEIRAELGRRGETIAPMVKPQDRR